jgi:hypothetical protein
VRLAPIGATDKLAGVADGGGTPATGSAVAVLSNG